MTYHRFFPNTDLIREVHLHLEDSPRLAARVSARDVTALRDARDVASTILAERGLGTELAALVDALSPGAGLADPTTAAVTDWRDVLLAIAVIDGLAPPDCDPLLASLDPDDPLGRLVGPYLPHGPGCPCEPLH
ncbi:hypothetical protein GCM10010467_03780 [Actinocorallia glomerata]|uniref:Uncharacterized protein n=2 Tax=Actinomycetes TaxID=1760 RepID=A0ABP6M2I2_9MICC